MTPPLRLVFLGSPAFAVPSLQALLADPAFAVAAVFSQPDRPRGRGRQLMPTPVKEAALAAGLPVHTPASLRRDPGAVATLAGLAPDVLVVVAYGLLLPPPVLAIPRLGAVNLHASLLPRHRGAAPIAAALLAGDAVTGNSVMLLNDKMDEGDVLARGEVPIAADDDEGSLRDKLARAGAPLLLAALADLAAGRAVREPQDHARATYAPKLDDAAAQLDWHRPADVLARQVRAMNPEPGAWFSWAGEKMRLGAARAAVADQTGPAAAAPGTVLVADARQGLLRVACAGGSALDLLRLQRPGKNMIATGDFLRGRPVTPGTPLG